MNKMVAVLDFNDSKVRIDLVPYGKSCERYVSDKYGLSNTQWMQIKELGDIRTFDLTLSRFIFHVLKEGISMEMPKTNSKWCI